MFKLSSDYDQTQRHLLCHQVPDSTGKKDRITFFFIIRCLNGHKLKDEDTFL